MAFCKFHLRSSFVVAQFFFFAFLSNSLFGGVVFDPGPGTGPPPAVFNKYVMRTFEPDPTALLTPTTSLPSPSQCGNSLRFSTPALHLKVGQGWETWSHGYSGDVYTYFDQTAAIILLPQGTRAFYFYTEPNVYSNYTAEAIADDGTSSGPITIQGYAGAKFIGFYVTGSQCLLKTIKITYPPAAGGFAIAEFAISCMPAIPTMSEWGLILLGLGLLSIAGVFMFRRKLVFENGMATEMDHSINQMIPFHKELMLMSWLAVGLIGIFAFNLAILGFGYQLTGADVPGFGLSSLFIAYIVHLGITYQRRP